jgi:hypothetical protein
MEHGIEAESARELWDALDRERDEAVQMPKKTLPWVDMLGALGDVMAGIADDTWLLTPLSPLPSGLSEIYMTSRLLYGTSRAEV